MVGYKKLDFLFSLALKNLSVGKFAMWLSGLYGIVQVNLQNQKRFSAKDVIRMELRLSELMTKENKNE